jgi:hypothetical protein
MSAWTAAQEGQHTSYLKKPNAAAQPRLEAEATQERKL